MITFRNQGSIVWEGPTVQSRGEWGEVWHANATGFLLNLLA